MVVNRIIGNKSDLRNEELTKHLLELNKFRS